MVIELLYGENGPDPNLIQSGIKICIQFRRENLPCKQIKYDDKWHFIIHHKEVFIIDTKSTERNLNKIEFAILTR